jgi:hypothetical protein
MISEQRFRHEQSIIVGGTKLCGRMQVNPTLSTEDALDDERFLRQLWTHFGPPELIDEGFSYNIRDDETNLKFRAYSGASGPSYGGSVNFFSKPIAGKLLPNIQQVLEVFDAWLETTPLSNNWELTRDSNSGKIRIGMRNGIRFKKREEEHKQTNLTSESDLGLDHVNKLAENLPSAVSWQTILEQVLPELPETISIDGNQYSWCLGLSVDQQLGAYYLFDEGFGLEEILLEEIRFDKPLSVEAQSWLSTYQKWSDQLGLPRRAPVRKIHTE